MKNKIIIFDLDGVLFKSDKLVNDYFLSIYPTMTKKIMSEILTGNFHEELEKFKLTNKPIEQTEKERKSRQNDYSARKSKVPLYEGVRELLESLHSKGLTVVINTSAFEKNCLPLLEYSNINKFFDFVATAEVSKSKVEKFEMIANKYNAPKEEMIFITDTLGDIREADKADVPTVAVTWGAHDVSYFKREPHKNLVAIVESVSELENLIEKITFN